MGSEIELAYVDPEKLVFNPLDGSIYHIFESDPINSVMVSDWTKLVLTAMVRVLKK